MSDLEDLRSKIAQAKVRPPLPDVLSKLGLGEHAKKIARCPFHKPHNHSSFSMFKGVDGFWHWNCFVGCGDGDEIDFVATHYGTNRSDAISRYLDMAGLPPSRPVSREYPESPASPASLSICISESPCVSVSPVSEGQGSDSGMEQELNRFAARNACTARNTARERRFKLLRDLKAVEGTGRQLQMVELMIAFGEWHRLSLPFLDPKKTRSDYLAAFLAEFGRCGYRRVKARWPKLSKRFGSSRFLSFR